MELGKLRKKQVERVMGSMAARDKNVASNARDPEEDSSRHRPNGYDLAVTRHGGMIVINNMRHRIEEELTQDSRARQGLPSPKPAN